MPQAGEVSLGRRGEGPRNSGRKGAKTTGNQSDRFYR